MRWRSQQTRHIFTGSQANLQYLDLAVLLRVWDGCRLSELLEELLSDRVTDVSPAAVVASNLDRPRRPCV
jgi:hypothetical protein